ncbi:tetratricopeptide repeat protein [Roseovarius sp. EL26]|uniref:tetratricopeptide repeat protein n=1 Tax=Roseovarius sp. EL26 TaxID=2126672 RepID=UPI0020B1373A|nr:tetratricopeptide repeat protein [Roseovarius sp. EL26]
MRLKPFLTITLISGLQGLAFPATAEDSVGAYLAAQQARYNSDYSAEARYFSEVLTRDPANPAVLESAAAAYLRLGQLDNALPMAQAIEAAGLRSQVANIVLTAADAQSGDYEALIKRANDERGIGDLADGLMVAWAHLGLGDMSAAQAKFDEVAKQRGVKNFVLYHKALALASVGDFESADQIFSGADLGPVQNTRRGMIAWSQILSQLDRNEEAIEKLNAAFGNNRDPEITALRASLAEGESIPFSLIHSPMEGLAEVFYSLGQALAVDSGESYTLFYSRAAQALKPDHIDAIILSAELLESLRQYDLATAAYKSVPRNHPSFFVAELGRADALRRSEKPDAAIEVLTQLSESHAELPLVHVSTGDLHRQQEQFSEAADAYDQAIEIYDELGTQQWFVYYVRGISQERLGHWEKAEADFRKALEINPEQPDVLNYLGYTMVEKRVNFDEALDMIERAVKARPDSGYIVDSLGWVLYRLGRYEEAIGHMERAAELEPVDPVLNDHLGDVLWAVDRKTEAEFQWSRALSFYDEDKPSPDIDPDRIRRKLEVGLDEVLAEEGAEPLAAVNDAD